MSLLCSLGFHVPDGIPRWNDGYYFATCRRCGRDIVRTAFEKWHEPVGYKVVWSAQPPEDRPEIAVVPIEAVAALVDDDAVPGPSRGSGEMGGPEHAVPARGDAETTTPAVPDKATPIATAADEPASADISQSPPPPPVAPRRRGSALPIEAVFARLRAEKAPPSPEAPPLEETTQSPEAENARIVRPSTPPRPSSWDFMDDDAGEELVPAPTSGSTRGGGTASVEPDMHEEPRPGMRDRFAGAGARLRRGAARLTPGFLSDDEPSPLLVIASALFISSAIALIVTFAIPSPSPPTSTPAPVTQQAISQNGNAVAPPTTAQPVKQAFVAASTLSCRAAPTLQAKRVKTLARGARVTILGGEGEWASLGYQGRQCWAEARFVSDLPPL